MKTKETKYYIICIAIFLIAIGISTIARHAPQPLPGEFLTSHESGFQVQMGGLFSLCLQAIFIIVLVRMRRLLQIQAE
ncbi:MAG: hypothetical protein WCL18_00485 [bacterium]